MHGRFSLHTLAWCLFVSAISLTEAHAASQFLNPALAAQAPDTDLHALALDHLEPARAGGVESQWVLRTIVGECGAHLERFPTVDSLLAPFRVRGSPGTHSYERAIEYGNRIRRTAEARCLGFRSDPLERFGAASDWYARALEAQHPLALLERAIETTKGHKGGAFPAETHALMRQALRSGRADVLWAFAIWDLERALGLDERRARGPQAVPWLLLACARGFPCAPGSHWLIQRDPESASREVRAWLAAPHSYGLPANADAQAVRLGELMEAGRWDDVFADLYL